MQGKPRLGEAIAEYLWNRERRCAEETVAMDRSLLARLRRSVGDIQLRHLTARHVERAFYDRLIGSATKASTANMYRKRLKLFFDFCPRRGYLRCDPMAEVKPQRVMREERLRLP